MLAKPTPPQTPPANGIFCFAGGEYPLPGHVGEREHATFGGYDRDHGASIGGLNALLANKIPLGPLRLVSGEGMEGGFQTQKPNSFLDRGVQMQELDAGDFGVGYLLSSDGELSIFAYIETPASKRFGGGFMGGGLIFK
ncbi:MAG TPA: hypothetical protein VG347_02055 [Verrucomicrobiae bacterium]|nr:hypothetical protein [Verrucomicrobiae bacterium]